MGGVGINGFPLLYLLPPHISPTFQPGLVPGLGYWVGSPSSLHSEALDGWVKEGSRPGLASLSLFS